MGVAAGGRDLAPEVRRGLLLWAWVSVLLIPVLVLVAMAVGYVLYDLFGYKPENADAPLWVDVAVSVPVLMISLAPCVMAMRFGRLARAAGDRSGLVPFLLGSLAGLALVVTTGADLVAR
jgi:hypothetical protein